MWAALAAVAGAAINYFSNERTNAKNAQEAKNNRQFQEYMSNTAYQRGAADMEAAGLNRILALGQPASTPSGAQAVMQNPDIVSGAVAAASAKQMIDQSKAEERLINQRENESEATEALALENVLTTRTQGELNTALAGLAEANKGAAESTARLNNAKATQAEKLDPVYRGVNDVLNFLDDKFRSSAKDDGRGVLHSLGSSAKDFIEDKLNDAVEAVREKSRFFKENNKYRTNMRTD